MESVMCSVDFLKIRDRIADYITSDISEFLAIISKQIEVIGTDITVMLFQGWNVTILAQSRSFLADSI